MVLNSTTSPAILIETGFISNEGDRSKLVAADYAGRFADVVYGSIVKYFEEIGK